MNNFVIPCATIRPDRIVQYEYWHGDRKKQVSRPKTNLQKAHISKKASQRLEASIYLLCQSATTKRIWDKNYQRWFSFKVNFITLTLPSKQIHSDVDIFRSIFKPFIRWWRGKNPSLLYIWKAEKQDNGNLHFHITSNSFIHWRTLRSKWNMCCESLGYVSRYAGNDPNSTDVHSVRNIRRLPAYLASYMTKKDLYKTPLKRWHKWHDTVLKKDMSDSFKLPKNYFNNIKKNVECKHWDCSKLLLNNKCTIVTDTLEFNYDINAMDCNNVESVSVDYCRIWKPTVFQWNNLGHFKAAYDNFIGEIRRISRLSIAIE